MSDEHSWAPKSLELSQSNASTTAPAENSPCEICKEKGSIYTCPRCSVKTCSLKCSTSHKSTTGCSGQRNKAAYVTMNQYTWGTMMDDYVFLEEVGRKLGEWGRDISQGGYVAQDGSAGLRGGMRGRRQGRGGMYGKGKGRTKRDVLKMQLYFRDIEMELLPNGMERRKLNQSTWDFKNKTALLTIEFEFHSPPDSLRSSASAQPPFTLLTHRNNLDAPLLSLMQNHVSGRELCKSKTRSDTGLPPWIKSLVHPAPEDPESFVQPLCLLPGPSRLNTIQSYFQLDPTQKLSSALRHKTFVEFPTIEVWEEGSFQGVLVDQDEEGKITFNPGAIAEEEGRRPKRRRLNKEAARKAINSLLGGYGSDGDEENKAEEKNLLMMLGGYAESGEDDEDEWGDEDAEGETDEEIGLEERHGEDYEALIARLRQAQEELRGREEDEEVDWSDSTTEEVVDPAQD